MDGNKGDGGVRALVGWLKKRKTGLVGCLKKNMMGLVGWKGRMGIVRMVGVTLLKHML